MFELMISFGIGELSGFLIGFIFAIILVWKNVIKVSQNPKSIPTPSTKKEYWEWLKSKE